MCPLYCFVHTLQSMVYTISNEIFRCIKFFEGSHAASRLFQSLIILLVRKFNIGTASVNFYNFKLLDPVVL